MNNEKEKAPLNKGEGAESADAIFNAEKLINEAQQGDIKSLSMLKELIQDQFD